MIAEGHVSPGTRLPSERELAVLLGVSRASVREAIHELTLKGLVTREQGRGTVVKETDGRGLGASLLGLLEPASREVRTILDFREAIEPPIAARAAQRATPSDIRNLTAVLDEMARAPSRADFAAMDRRFHQVVARTTHNPLLTSDESAPILARFGVGEHRWRATRPSSRRSPDMIPTPQHRRRSITSG